MDDVSIVLYSPSHMYMRLTRRLSLDIILNLNQEGNVDSVVYPTLPGADPGMGRGPSFLQEVYLVAHMINNYLPHIPEL